MDQIALAPDGRHLAHMVRAGDTISLVITDIDQPTKNTGRVIGKDVAASLFQGRGATFRAGVTFLQWAGPDRLIYAVNQAGGGAEEMGSIDQIWTIDADGRNHRKLVDGEQLGDYPPEDFNNGEEGPPRRKKPEIEPRRLNVLGFRFPDPDALAVEVLPVQLLKSILETRSAVYSLNVRTGKYVGLSSERALGRYLYDQQAHPRLREPPGSWVRPPLGSAEATTIFEPQSYQVRSTPDSRAWRELDSVLSRDLPRAPLFHTSIETHYSSRSFPIGFDTDPNLVYFASNIGRETFALYALDLRTGHPTDFAVEDPVYDIVDPNEAFNDSILIFDRQRKLVGVRLPGPHLRIRWLDAPLARIQNELEKKFPHRDVSLLDWDDARSRFVVHVGSLDDPGRDYIYDIGPIPRLRQFLRRAPLYSPEHLNHTEDFAFDTSSGVHLTGRLTMPHHARVTQPPLILICDDIPGSRDQPGVDSDTQALADLGFAVAKIKYRGAAGLGARHRDAVREDLDRLPVEDLRETVRWLATRHTTDPKRVALFGRDLGGYFALNTARIYPEEFRCVVTINAPLDPVRWLSATYDSRLNPTYEQKVRDTFFDAPTLARIKVVPLAESLSRPAMMVQDEFKNDLASNVGRDLVHQLNNRGISSEYVAAPADFSNGEPEARAKIFGRIAVFLNQQLYDFKVDVGEVKEVK